MEKKDIKWSELGFGYIKTDLRFEAVYKNGKWSKGSLIESEYLQLHEGSPALHYSQECFEGLKAQTAKDGRVLLFRSEMNAKRMIRSAERILMPAVPEDLFLEAVHQTVKANYAWIPPYGSGASLYIRPMLIGVADNLGLTTAKEFIFRVFVAPVGPYYKGGGVSLVSLAVSDFDRAAPNGTGAYKIGANYSGGLLATAKAKELGANEALYLDAVERKYLEEAGSANILVAMTNNRLVTPKSDAILPSVTRISLMQLADKEMGLSVEERPIHLKKEIKDFTEVAACGTAAVLSPVSKIWYDNQWNSFFDNGQSVGPVMQKLYDLLTQIQKGEIEDKFKWTDEVVI
jgi:branched-chain amino acid aminotransferase